MLRKVANLYLDLSVEQPCCKLHFSLMLIGDLASDQFCLRQLPQPRSERVRVGIERKIDDAQRQRA